MGLMFRRRRPLLRGAMLAGGATLAYQAGKRQQQDLQHEYDQDEAIAMSQAQMAPAPPAAAPATDTVSELERLKGLLDAGALTQEEFDAAKRQVLQG